MTPQTANAIVQERLATGSSYRELAAQFGTSPSSIVRTFSKPEIQDILETGMQQQISLIPKAIDTVRELLNDDDKRIRLDSAKIVMQNTGMSPSHTPSTILVRMTQVNNNIQLSGRLEEALKLVDAQSAMPHDAIDISLREG